MSESAAQAAPTPETPSSLPSCKCGYTREDEGRIVYVEAQPEWTAWGWVKIMMIGITTIPVRVKFFCNQCHSTIEISTDPKVLKSHI